MNEKIKELQKDLCNMPAMCKVCEYDNCDVKDGSCFKCRAVARDLYDKDYRKQHRGTWIDLGDQRCQCSECGAVRYGNSKEAIEKYHLAPFCEKCGAFMQNDKTN